MILDIFCNLQNNSELFWPAVVCDQQIPLSGATLTKLAVLRGPVNNDNGSWAGNPTPHSSAC